MSLVLPLWSPTIGDVNLTAALINEILGGTGGGGIVNTQITTIGNGVLTAAAIVGGQVARSGPTGPYSDTTDTAAAIVTAAGGFNLGEAIEVRFKNATTFPQTILGGTGVTMPAAGAVVPPLGAGSYFATMTGTAAAPTLTFTHEETVPIFSAAVITDEQTSALTTVGAGTILAASINGGVVLRGGVQIAAFTDSFDTVANIIAGVSALTTIVGSAVEFLYVNNTIFPATLSGVTNVTLSGITVVPANSWAKFLVTMSAAGTVTVVGVEQGYFPKTGVTGAANGATPVAVADAAVTANSIITLTINTLGGTVHGAFVSAKTAGTGFSINSLAGDTSTYNYEIRG